MAAAAAAVAHNSNTTDYHHAQADTKGSADFRSSATADLSHPKTGDLAHHGSIHNTIDDFEDAIGGFFHSVIPSTPKSVGSEGVKRLQNQLESEQAEREKLEGYDKPGHWLVENNLFKGIIMFLVCVNAVLMGVQCDHPEWEQTWSISDHIFGAAFTIEMVTKWVTLRLDYFRDRWNWLDCVLASMGFMDTWFVTLVGGSNLGLQQFSILRVLRLLRLVRLARLFRQFGRLVIVMRSIVDAIETTFWVASVLLICIYVCAIFCVDFIGKSGDLYPGYSEDVAVIDEQEVMMNFNPHIVFGSMSGAMVTLFNIAILAEWTEIIRPVLLKQPAMVFFFLLFSIFVCFGVMNVIIGMIVDSVMCNARTLEREFEEARRSEKVDLLEQLKEAIFSVDTSGNLEIDLGELDKLLTGDDPRLKSIMTKVCLPYGCCAEEFLALLDNDGDGRLAHEEFVQSMYRLINCGPFQQTCLIQIGVNKLMCGMNNVGKGLEKISKQIGQQSKMMKLQAAESRQTPKENSPGTTALRPRIESDFKFLPSSTVDSPGLNGFSMDDDSPGNDYSSAASIARPELAACLDAVCKEVSSAIHATLREELMQGFNRVLAAGSKKAPVDKTKMTGQWEVIEDKLHQLDAKHSQVPRKLSEDFEVLNGPSMPCPPSPSAVIHSFSAPDDSPPNSRPRPAPLGPPEVVALLPLDRRIPRDNAEASKPSQERSEGVGYGYDKQGPSTGTSGSVENFPPNTVMEYEC